MTAAFTVYLYHGVESRDILHLYSGRTDKNKRHFCLACEAEARHMYCFSGVVVVVGGVNFFEFLHLGHFFSETIRARGMKLGSRIHLDECSS